MINMNATANFTLPTGGGVSFFLQWAATSSYTCVTVQLNVTFGSGPSPVSYL